MDINKRMLNIIENLLVMVIRLYDRFMEFVFRKMYDVDIVFSEDMKEKS
jgi:hypothetical protein